MHSIRIATASFAALVALSGCASAVDGKGEPATSGSSPSTPAPTGSSAPVTPPAPATSGSTNAGGGFPTDIDELGALLLHGNSNIKSAHLELTEDAAGTSVTGSGDEKLADGKVTAIDLSEDVGSISLRFVLVNGKVFAMLPDSFFSAPTPWVQISPDTTDSRLSGLYTSLQSSIQTGTGDTVGIFVKAAKDVQLVGKEKIDGDTVGHYKLNVDIASLPSDFPGLDALLKSGISKIPVEIYVDEQGRTRKVTEDFAIGGQSVKVEFTLSKIDEPVDIKEPPADQVTVE